MSRSTLLIGTALAAALLAGCSGTSNDGNASAASTSSTSSTAAPSSSTSTTSTSTTSSTTTTTSDEDTTAEETTSDEETTEDEATGSVQAASLDDDSKVWFGTFCTGLTGAFTGMMGAMGGMMNTTAPSDPAATQATLVAAYQQIGTSFTETADSLEGLPAPGVENGEQLAQDLPAAMRKLGEGVTTAPDNFAAAQVTDEASLSAAMDAFSTETDQYSQELEAQFGDLDTILTPEIGEAVKQLPECQMMGS